METQERKCFRKKGVDSFLKCCREVKQRNESICCIVSNNGVLASLIRAISLEG